MSKKIILLASLCFSVSVLANNCPLVTQLNPLPDGWYPITPDTQPSPSSASQFSGAQAEFNTTQAGVVACQYEGDKGNFIASTQNASGNFKVHWTLVSDQSGIRVYSCNSTTDPSLCSW